jgi:protein gp37
MENSKINWTDNTFDPWRGCTKVDCECWICYAENQVDRRYATNLLPIWGQNGERPLTSDDYWKLP